MNISAKRKNHLRRFVVAKVRKRAERALREGIPGILTMPSMKAVRAEAVKIGLREEEVEFCSLTELTGIGSGNASSTGRKSIWSHYSIEEIQQQILGLLKKHRELQEQGVSNRDFRMKTLRVGLRLRGWQGGMYKSTKDMDPRKGKMIAEAGSKKALEKRLIKAILRGKYDDVNMVKGIGLKE